jgi:hypothetical protein
MQPLLFKLEAQGLSEDQIQKIFLTLYEWLDDNYPVIARISKQAMVQELGIKELSLPFYVAIDRK